LFLAFHNLLIFKSKKIYGIKTGSQLATLFVTFSSAQDLSLGLCFQKSIEKYALLCYSVGNLKKINFTSEDIAMNTEI